MDDVSLFPGYSGKYGEDGFPSPGELIKHYRIKLNMSQEQLANELDCSRVMVTRMENENHGLNDISTRRNLAKVLGIAPVMLGLISREDAHSAKRLILYDTTLLKRSLTLHREVYFSSGDIGGIPEIDVMTRRIFSISSSLDHKNKDILSILCQYGQLGIDIGREERNYKAVERYGKWASTIAHKLNDQNLLASTLLRYAAAMYEKGDIEQARRYADEAMAQSHIPPKLQGGVILEASRVYARLGNPDTLKLLDKACNITRRHENDEDVGFVRLNSGFCQQRIATALFDTGDYTGTLTALDLAEEQTSLTHMRRRCAIQNLQARTCTMLGNYYDATHYASTALTLASAVSSHALLNVIDVYKSLKESSFGTSREVIKLGKRLTQTIDSRSLPLPG